MGADELIIRAARQDDVHAVLAIYAPLVEHTAISFETAVPTVEQMVARMRAEVRLPWLVAEQERRVVGYAYAAPHRERQAYRWSVDTSIYVGERGRGRGVGRALYERLLPEVAGLNYAAAFAGIALPNPASVRLHEAVGFRPIGVFPRVGYKFGEWRDVGWWWRALTGADREPAEPVPWTGA